MTRRPTRTRVFHRRLPAIIAAPLLAALALAAGGCSLIGAAAAKTVGTTVKPNYTGLAGQSVGVMVTVDQGTKIDYPRLQLDVAQSVQAKLAGAQTNKAEELKGTQFPAAASPQAVFAFQRNYPQYDVEPVANIAPRLGVSRLVYVEIDSFSLNPADVLELFRGEVAGRVRVVEVANGTAKVAFTDQVSAFFPEKGSEHGTPNLNRPTTYRGVVDAFGTAVVQKFVSYETN